MGDPEVRLGDGNAGAGKSGRICRRFWRSIKRPLQARVGGTARLREIALLASILALSTADLGIISAVAVPLKSSLGVDNAGIGILVSAATAVGAIATLPMASSPTARTALIS